MDLSDSALTFVSLIACALAGRIVLSFLPPGAPGGHRLDELPVTWAASHMCGSIALDVERRLLMLVGWEPSPWLLAAPWALALAVRLSTLPGAMVPRHEPRTESWGATARIVAASALALPITSVVVTARAGMYTGARTDLWLAAADEIALLLILSFGLERARRAPLSRALVLFVLAAFFALHGATGFGSAAWRSILCVGAGAAFAIPWLRRADRRAKALSILAFASAAFIDRPAALVGASGLVVLAWRTPAPSRRGVAIASLVALVLCFALSPALDDRPAWSAGSPIVPWMPLGSFVSIAFDAALALSIVSLVVTEIAVRGRQAVAADGGSTAFLVVEPRAEISLLGALLCVSLCALALGAVTGALFFPAAALCSLSGVVLLACGLSASRAVRVERTS